MFDYFSIKHRWVKMSPHVMENLLGKIGPYLEKEKTRPDVVGARERMMIALRYMFTGESLSDLARYSNMVTSTVSACVKDVCEAIWDVLSLTHLVAPDTQEEWLEISDKFQEDFGFPHCLGALCYRRLHIMGAKSSQKQCAVLFAVVKSDYSYSMVDVQLYDDQHDSKVFAKSTIAEYFMHPDDRVPGEKHVVVGDRNCKLPFVLLGEQQFPLQPWLSRKYSSTTTSGHAPLHKLYNKQFQKVHSVADNALGVMYSNFQVLRGLLRGNVELMTSVLKACCALHNFLLAEDCQVYKPVGMVDADTRDESGTWRTDGREYGGKLLLHKQDIEGTTRRGSADTCNTRTKFAQYLFISEEDSISSCKFQVIRAILLSRVLLQIA